MFAASGKDVGFVGKGSYLANYCSRSSLAATPPVKWALGLKAHKAGEGNKPRADATKERKFPEATPKLSSEHNLALGQPLAVTPPDGPKFPTGGITD